MEASLRSAKSTNAWYLFKHDTVIAKGSWLWNYSDAQNTYIWEHDEKPLNRNPISATHRLKKKRRIKTPQANCCLSTYLSLFFFSLPPFAFLSSLFLLVREKKTPEKENQKPPGFFIMGGNWNKAREQSNARQTYSAVNTIVQFLRLAIKRNFHLKLSRKLTNVEIENCFYININSHLSQNGNLKINHSKMNPIQTLRELKSTILLFTYCRRIAIISILAMLVKTTTAGSVELKPTKSMLNSLSSC